MIPYAFKYHRVTSLADAQALFAKSPEAKFLAGGQTLIPTMKQRLANPPELIDISAIADLDFVRLSDDKLVIGAGVRHGDVAASKDVMSAIPALGELALTIGDPAVRAVGTLGGSIANNDPAADYPAAALGLGATIVTTKRSIAADDYFTGMFETALEDGEIVTEVSFPIPARAGYAKFYNPASRYAMVGVFVSELGGNVRVAVTGAAPCVFRVNSMEAALTKSFATQAIETITIAADNMNSDLHGSAEYRAHLVSVMAKRAVQNALNR